MTLKFNACFLDKKEDIMYIFKPIEGELDYNDEYAYTLNYFSG